MRETSGTKRIFLYHYLTLGFYFIVWCARSRREIQRSAGRQLIPTLWLLIVPFGNFWWMWQYSQALEYVSYRRIKGSDVFLLYVVVVNAWLVLDVGVRHWNVVT